MREVTGVLEESDLVKDLGFGVLVPILEGSLGLEGP